MHYMIHVRLRKPDHVSGVIARILILLISVNMSNHDQASAGAMAIVSLISNILRLIFTDHFGVRLGKRD